MMKRGIKIILQLVLIMLLAGCHTPPVPKKPKPLDRDDVILFFQMLNTEKHILAEIQYQELMKELEESEKKGK